jgi:methionyl aminopeptidase
MVIAIEPMLNMGTKNVIFDNDGYTVRTADGKRSAHFEHTILITKDGPKILTQV